MGRLDIQINISREYRPCYYLGEKALFHTLEYYQRVIPPDLMIGGHNGGMSSEMFAIVELQNGKLIRAKINEIKFIDSKCTEILREYFYECDK